MLRQHPLMLFLIWLLVVLACGLAAAAPPPPAQPVPQRTLVLSPQDCNALVETAPAPDVDYRGAVDVNGRAVAPADLPGSALIRLPDAFPVGINLYIGDPAGLPQTAISATPETQAAPITEPGTHPGWLYGPEASIGEVAVVRTPWGHDLYFNGQPLADPLQASIRRACAEWQARRSP